MDIIIVTVMMIHFIQSYVSMEHEACLPFALRGDRMSILYVFVIQKLFVEAI